jgi:hypothetical protein
MKWFRRGAWAVAGIVWIFWLGYEDRNLISLIVVAALVAFALGVEGLNRWTESRPTVGLIWLIRSIIVGALTGAAVGPIAVLLALIKISLHSHPTPDFSVDDIRELVRNSLPWIATGSLFGAAVGFVRLSQKNHVDRGG